MATEEKPIALARVVCGVVLCKNSKYLLVQESWPTIYGLWNLPAGRVDEGESLEQAAIRETEEETGYKVKLTKHLIALHTQIDRPVLHAYSAEIVEGKLNFPKDELLDARWFDYDEIIAMKNKLRDSDYVLGAIEATRES
jgi:8-oxo-dGTP diphosphatase